MLKYIRSPLNYTGNKYRILNEIVPKFPKDINILVDMFSGGATVGLNIDCKKVYFVDSNPMVIGLLKFLSKSSFEKLLLKIENIINEYGLTYSFKEGNEKYKNVRIDNNGLKSANKVGYYKLRKEYNDLLNKNTQKAYLMLYVLMIYAFNNDIRFNSQGEFNLPVGKTDMNKNNVNKLKDFIQRVHEKECEFVCADYSSSTVLSIIKKADFIYFDPPYLITDAVYNTYWKETDEKKLLNYITVLIDKYDKRVAISNVLETKSKSNKYLLEWFYSRHGKYNLYDINYHYKSASYNKKDRSGEEREILITCNYENK